MPHKGIDVEARRSVVDLILLRLNVPVYMHTSGSRTSGCILLTAVIEVVSKEMQSEDVPVGFVGVAENAYGLSAFLPLGGEVRISAVDSPWAPYGF